MFKITIGVRNITFNAAHYTLGLESKCMNLHGHTYRVDVEISGSIDESTGMVLDFIYLKNVVREIVEDYDHKIIIPRRDLGRVCVEGPFKTSIKVIDYPYATAEYIALDIAKRIYDKLKLPIRVKLFEGFNNYVIVEYYGEDLEAKRHS